MWLVSSAALGSCERLSEADSLQEQLAGESVKYSLDNAPATDAPGPAGPRTPWEGGTAADSLHTKLDCTLPDTGPALWSLAL